MAWRGLHVSRSATLLLRQGQCVVVQEGEEATFPLEDIAWIVLDSRQAMLSGPLLSELARHGIPFLVPDERHHPVGVLLPFHTYFAQSRIAHLQVAVSEPFRKRVWQALIVAKISNQAAVLRIAGKPGWERLEDMSEKVASGDEANLEAQAARFYWSRLFQEFVREPGGDRRNSLIDYGYAVARAALARACVASGLLPAFGFHHRSQVNPFNLIDDLIEPFRPFVDRLALARLEHSPGNTGDLNLEDRRAMVGILMETAVLPEGDTTLLTATETTATSVARAVESREFRQVVLPRMKP